MKYRMLSAMRPDSGRLAMIAGFRAEFPPPAIAYEIGFARDIDARIEAALEAPLIRTTKFDFQKQIELSILSAALPSWSTIEVIAPDRPSSKEKSPNAANWFCNLKTSARIPPYSRTAAELTVSS